MDPAQVRANLTRRATIAREALTRLARTNRANGYDPDVIEEALGTLAPLMSQQERDQNSAPAMGAARGTIAGGIEGNPTSPDGTPLTPAREGPDSGEDFSQMIQAAPPGSDERFAMLERLHNAGPARIAIGLGDNPSEDQFIDEFGLNSTQRAELEAEYQRELAPNSAHSGTVARREFATEHPVLANVDAFGRSAANALTLGLADRIAGTMSGSGAEFQHAITGDDWQNRTLSTLGGTLVGGSRLPLGTGLPAQTGLGALYGGVYNYNATDGTQAERLQAGAGGALAGGAISSLVGIGLRAAGRGGGGTPGNVELVRAAERQGVDLMPADVGGPLTRRATGGTGQTLFGSGQVIRGAQRTENQVGNRVDEIAREEGTPVRQEVLGDRTRETLEGFNNRSGRYGQNLYASARDMSQDTLLNGSGAFRNLNGQIRELSETPTTSAPLISGLNRLRDDIATDEGLRSLSVDGIRRLRSNVRSEAQTESLRSTDYQRRATQVLDDLSADIERQLPAEAAREFRRADNLWRERLDFIDDVENNILGPSNDRSAEAVARRLIGMSRGDSARFRRVLETVPAEEAGIIRGSVIQELGRATDGSPNAGGFSLDRFLTNYEGLPDRTRELLFRGQSRADVEDLISVARARREASGYINRSGTGGAVNTGQLIQNSNQAVQGASGLLALGTVGTTAVLENLTGRMLSSPRLVRIIARPPRDPGRLIRGLRRVAVAEPAISQDIGRLIAAVQSSGQDIAPAIGRAAAEDDGQNRR